MAHLRNRTIVLEVVFLGFESFSEYKVLSFLFLLLIFTFTFSENLLIVLVICRSPPLHSPMYLLIGNLLFCEMIYISNLAPPLMQHMVSGRWAMDFLACLVQINVMIGVTAVEIFLLTLMSFDRYLAICQPLRYSALVHSRLCWYLVVGFWVASLVIVSAIFYLLVTLVFCGPLTMQHFVCEFTMFVSSACIMSDFTPLAMYGLVVSAILNAPFFIILVSYILIIISILRIRTSAGRRKAFSTCGSHLIVVTIYFAIPFFASMVPGGGNYYNLMSAIYYGVPPLVNPIIYSLRNQEIHKALQVAVSDMKTYFSIKIHS